MEHRACFCVSDVICSCVSDVIYPCVSDAIVLWTYRKQRGIEMKMMKSVKSSGYAEKDAVVSGIIHSS